MNQREHAGTKRRHTAPALKLVLVIAAVVALSAAAPARAQGQAESQKQGAAQSQAQPESQKQSRAHGQSQGQAQLKVITSGGFAAAFQELQPEFEKATGTKVTVTRGASQGSGPDTIGAQLRRGVAADVVIMSREGLDDLIKEGRIVAGSDVNLGQTPLGASVRAGASKPDIGTVEAFKQTMLRAKSVTFPGSTTGIYMVEKLFPRLGIAKEMAPKTTSTGVAAVAKGDAEIAVQPVSELLHAPGTDFVGTLPAEIQYVSVFSTAVLAARAQVLAARAQVLAARAQDEAARPEEAVRVREAKALIAFLTSEKAKAAIKKTGMEPVKAR